MDISKINSNLTNNTITTAKSKAIDDSFEKALKEAYDKKDYAQLKAACNQFETIFINMMFKEMKATIMKSSLASSDPGKEIYDSLMEENLIEEATKNRGIGISDMLYKSLSKSLSSLYTTSEKGAENA